jgi:CheY-like chemotaxis protein
MNRQIQVLIVDDLADWRMTLSGLLEDEGYITERAAGIEEALNLVGQEHFDVALLDVRLDETDKDNVGGVKLARELRRRFREMLIIIITGYGSPGIMRSVLEPGPNGASLADDFLAKTETMNLVTVLNSLLNKSSQRQLPIFTPSQECRVTISLKPGQRLLVRGRGNLRFTYTSANPLEMDTARFVRWGSKRLMSTADRRFLIKEVGQELHRLLFVQHAPVFNGYHQALGRVSRGQYLHLVLESTRDLAGLPLEFLFSEEAGDYLALLHPMIRQIRGVVTRRAPISPAFIERTINSGDKIRILLLASNTKPRIDLIDEMGDQIADLLSSVDWIELTYVRTEAAAYPAIRKMLQGCKYHVVHYVGHGLFREDSPEQSCLVFWEGENRSGSVRPITGSQLRLLLQDSDTRLFHLTCCEGARAGDLADLLDDEYLGIADGAIQAGVPSVLGYRWPVSAASAKEITLAFYRSILRHGSPELALLEARRELAMRNKDDLTWASPILVVQN